MRPSTGIIRIVLRKSVRRRMSLFIHVGFHNAEGGLEIFATQPLCPLNCLGLISAKLTLWKFTPFHMTMVTL